MNFDPDETSEELANILTTKNNISINDKNNLDSYNYQDWGESRRHIELYLTSRKPIVGGVGYPCAKVNGKRPSCIDTTYCCGAGIDQGLGHR